MKILICNVGSTSLKYKLFDMDCGEAVLASGLVERVGAKQGLFTAKNHLTGEEFEENGFFPTHKEAIERMLGALIGNVLDSLEDLSCIGFKVVHAKGVSGVQYLTDDVLQKMRDFNCVAPAHNPPYLCAIEQFRRLLPDVPLIGAFETAFHETMPPEAKLYSIPLSISEKYEIRRYGFHGASHEYMSAWVQKQLGLPHSKIISCHLGGSGSICAVKDGKSVDTSMGLGLQCGILNNNRCGDIDPYIIFYLAEEAGMSLAEIKNMLQTQSGLYGLCGGVSNDLRDIAEKAAQGDEACALTIRAYAYGIKKYIGAYAAAMGGVDAIVFGGGIGRKSAQVRSLSLSGLEFLGITLDEDKNNAAGSGSDISANGAHVRLFVLDTNEEVTVARKAKKLLEQ